MADSSPGSSAVEDIPSLSFVDLHIEATLHNGLRIATSFSLPQDAIANCVLYTQANQFSIELNHHCTARTALYQAIKALAPEITRNSKTCWFRTLNRESNPTNNCLFEGIKLEMNFHYNQNASDYGICFPRGSFIAERNAFGASGLADQHQSLTAPNELLHRESWAYREPTDSERLRVNRQGYEVLYFFQPPESCSQVTVSDVRTEICRGLKIADIERVTLFSGPFIWDTAFQEDGKDLYTTYFHNDTVVEGRHMKTVRGSALIYVAEEHQ